MADRDYVPQWVREFRRLEEQENIRKTKELAEESVRIQKVAADNALRAAREEEERRRRSESRERNRIARLPKCPECQTPLEGNRPRRCAACRCEVFWILGKPLGVREVTQILTNPAEDPLIVRECAVVETELNEYRDKRRELLRFPWLLEKGINAPMTLGALAISERAQQVASAVLGEWNGLIDLDKEYRNNLKQQAADLRRDLRERDGKLIELYLMWGCLFVLSLFISVSSAMHPLFVLVAVGISAAPVPRWWAITKKQDAIRAELASLQARLDAMSQADADDKQNTDNIRVLSDKFEAVQNGNGDAFRDDDNWGSAHTWRRLGLLGWLGWRETLGEDLRQVFDAITSIAAINRLKWGSEQASRLLRDVNELSRERGQQRPPEIPRLSSLVAGFEEMLTGEGAGGPEQATKHTEARNDPTILHIIDALTLVAVADGTVSASEMQNIAGNATGVLSRWLTRRRQWVDRPLDLGDFEAAAETMEPTMLPLSDEDVLNRIRYAVGEIQSKGVKAFADAVRDHLLPYRGKEVWGNVDVVGDVLEAMASLAQQDGVHGNEKRVIEWFRKQLGGEAS